MVLVLQTFSNVYKKEFKECVSELIFMGHFTVPGRSTVMFSKSYEEGLYDYSGVLAYLVRENHLQVLVFGSTKSESRTGF